MNKTKLLNKSIKGLINNNNKKTIYTIYEK